MVIHSFCVCLRRMFLFYLQRICYLSTSFLKNASYSAEYIFDEQSSSQLGKHQARVLLPLEFITGAYLWNWQFWLASWWPTNDTRLLIRRPGVKPQIRGRICTTDVFYWENSSGLMLPRCKADRTFGESVRERCIRRGSRLSICAYGSVISCFKLGDWISRTIFAAQGDYSA